MSQPLPNLPEIEIVFIPERKESEKGFAEELDFSAKGFLFQQFKVRDPTSLRADFQWELVRKWVNFDVVAEVRFLPEGAIAQELAYYERLHQKIQEGLDEDKQR